MLQLLMTQGAIVALALLLLPLAAAVARRARLSSQGRRRVASLCPGR
jgi:hypothetical protein